MHSSMVLRKLKVAQDRQQRPATFVLATAGTLPSPRLDDNVAIYIGSATYRTDISFPLRIE